MSREVTLVLCSRSGQVLGSLSPFSVDSPWWPDVEPVVAAARDLHGVAVRVLRLLSTGGPGPSGGPVAYSAELDGDLPPAVVLRPVPADLAEEATREDPLRAPWARPAGLASTLAWADAALDAAGTGRCGEAVQVKTWNLSSVLRLPTGRGTVWCKSVPPFLAHEGAMIAAVGDGEPDLVPPVVAADRAAGTVLLADVPGEDQWEAPQDRLVAMVTRWVAVQAGWAQRVPELIDLGLPDWRSEALTAAVASLVRRDDVRAALDGPERAALDALLAALPERLAALDACGLPPTLVHGDLHPGNWRSDGRSLVLLDWGDSGVGHPLLDLTAFLPRTPRAAQDAVLEAWIGAWSAARPGADPGRAAELIEPVAALRQALIYQRFLDGIERSERRYHEGDVPQWLRTAIALAQA